MKKIFSVFMAVLMVFGACSAACFAAAPEAETTTAAAAEEETTRDIMTDDGLVVPLNWNQLKQSVIFKIFEKVIKFFLSLFGIEQGDQIDKEGATDVSDIVDWVDDLLTTAVA